MQDCLTPAQSWASGGTMTPGMRKSSKAKADPERDDRRRALSRPTHTRIVAAIMALIVGGDRAPSPAPVAGEAGLGLRHVLPPLSTLAPPSAQHQPPQNGTNP